MCWRDPELKAESAKEIKKRKLDAIYEQMFDEVELSRRTLGGKLEQTEYPAQQQEFIHLYRQVLEKAYMDKILFLHQREKLSSLKITCSRTTRLRFKRKSSPPQTKSLFLQIDPEGRHLEVYDVVVENVSLVQNYRSQFNSILAKNTPDQLLEILRKKVKGQ